MEREKSFCEMVESALREVNVESPKLGRCAFVAATDFGAPVKKTFLSVKGSNADAGRAIGRVLTGDDGSEVMMHALREWLIRMNTNRFNKAASEILQMIEGIDEIRMMERNA